MTGNSYRPNSQTKEGGPATSRRGARRFLVRKALAWMALLWERVWPRVWPMVAIATLFIAVALFDLLPDLAGWLHTAILCAFGVAFAATVLWSLRGLRLPSPGGARRRLEVSSRLDHRPLATTEDTIAVGGGSQAAEAVWRAHQERALRQLKGLRVGAPRPEVARRDPFALRGAALLLLILAVIIGGREAESRLARAFMPAFEPVASKTVTVEAWLTPPDYTGLPPRMLTAENGRKTVSVPDGTRIMIQVHGGRGAPHLSFGRQDIKLEALAKSSFQGEVLAKFDGQLVVRQRGRNIIDWPVRIVADKAPEVKLTKLPGVTRRSSIQLDYDAKDDYRIAAMRAYIARAGEVDVITLKIPAAGAKTARGSSFHDLSSHRWAGLDVAVVLEVEDDAGQRGKSQVMDLTLPERVFNHPVARAIIRQRKTLTEDPRKAPEVIDALGHIAASRSHFNNDPIVYLTLRVAQARLILGIDNDGRSDWQLRQSADKAIRSVQPMLWETALRVEEGTTAVNERELARLQQKLMELLSKKDVKDAELRKLLDKLREAMRRYMEALRRDMMRNPEKYARRPIDPKARTFNQQDMQQMMQRLRDLLNNGDKDALRRMLSQLQNMMRNLRFGQNRQQQARPMDPNHPMMKMLRQLGDLIQRQQKLMDESFRRGQRRRDGQNQDPKADQRAEQQQQELRKRLNELMRRLGEMTGKVPPNFGNAERQMRRAERRLGRGNPGDAVPPQGRALRELRRGAGQAMRQMARRFGIGPGPGMRQFSSRPGQERRGRDRDPLGRRLDGMGPLDTDDVKVPSEAERKKVRDILEELRRRSGEVNRPQIERDYIDRLLRRF